MTTTPHPPLAPDGRTWLEWCAEYHEDRAVEAWEDAKAMTMRSYKHGAKKSAEAHEAMATACREACKVVQP